MKNLEYSRNHRCISRPDCDVGNTFVGTYKGTKIAKNIRVIMQVKNFTKEEVAQQIGISELQLQNCLTRGQVTMNNLTRIQSWAQRFLPVAS